MPLNVLAEKPVDIAEFVEYWADRYGDKDEQLYADNIAKPRTEANARDLFRWKVSPRFYGYKLNDIDKHFIGRLHELAELPTDTTPQDFLARFSGGGVIWRIFWLHCWNQKYPIFDQHVYRAMRYIQTGKCAELPNNDEQKIDSYLTDYLPFYQPFAPFPERRGDKALVTYGSFLALGWLPKK